MTVLAEPLLVPETFPYKPERWLVGFCALHLIIWALLPAILQHNAPLDVVEGWAWGTQWLWGYEKHPWLAPWLTALSYKLSGNFVPSFQ